VSEEVLDDVEGMFNQRPHLRLGLLKGLQSFFQWSFSHCLDLPSFASHIPFYALRFGFHLGALFYSEVSRIGKDIRFGAFTPAPWFKPLNFSCERWLPLLEGVPN
jgi:hypothetical protein